jgi:uncharacterized membrane protein
VEKLPRFGLLSALAVIALALRLRDLGGPSLWVDEAMSVVFAAKPLPELFHLLVTQDIHPPLYPVLLHYWIAVAGNSETAVRLPSVLFGVMLVPLIYYSGSRLELMAGLKNRLAISLVGLVAATIAATSAFYVGYSQEARNYMAVTFMGLLSSYLLLVCLADLRRRNWVGYAVATVAALYTHYTAFLLLAFQLLFVLFTFRSRQGFLKRWLLSIAIVAVAYLPWLGYSVAQIERISDYWPGTLQLDAALRTSLLLFVAGGDIGPNGSILPIVLGLALLVVGLLALLLGSSKKMSPHLLFLLLYLLVPSALLFAVAYYRPKFDPRYLLVVTPAFYLTLAWGIGSLLRAAIRPIPLLLRAILPSIGIAALIGTVAVSAVYGEPSKVMHVGDGNTGVQQYGDYRALVAYIESHSQPGDAVVLMMNTYHPYVYYSKLHIPWYPMEPFDDFDGAIIRLNRLVAQHYQRLWFILWQPQWADPAGYVMDVMQHQANELPVDASFGGLGLRLFQLIPGQRFSYYPKVDHKIDARFGGDLLEFWGWNSSAMEVQAGGSVEFDLFWRPQRKAGGKLKTKLMLVDSEQHQFAIADDIMISPYYPPEQWKVQEILHDVHTLTVPVGTPPGTYEVQLLLYDENTMKVMNIQRSSGQSLGNILTLGSMTVTPTPESSFPPPDRPAKGVWFLGNDRIELLESHVSPTIVKPGEPADLELVWRAPTRVVGDYTLHVAFLDGQGNLVADQAVSLAPGYPASRWRPGEPVRTKHWLIAPTPPVARYEVAIALVGSSEKEVSPLRYTQVGTLGVQLEKTPTAAGSPTP